jgi:hypothetical protein
MPTRLSMIAMACLLSAVRTLARDLVIVENGRPQANIVIAEDAGDKVKVAAADLQAYIKKMSGAELPILLDSNRPIGTNIFVGKSNMTEILGVDIPSGLTGSRREEGFVIACRGDWLLLAGNDAGPYHGTEYAVYDFLNRLGVRWFMPGDYGEVVPKQETIVFAEQTITQKPDFVMRNWWLHALPEIAEQEKRWKLRNKMNPDPMFAIPGDSSARNITADPALIEEHPEYFAMNADGTRNPHLPNLSNPEAVRIAADKIKQFFRENPDANSYGFAPDDGLPRDYDPETVKLNQGFVEVLGRPGVPAEMSISEEWMRFVKAVTEEVRKEFPDAYIATNGYANRDIPPQGVTPDDHMVLMFAAIWSCTLHAYDDDHCWQKTRQGQMLKRWCELCKNVWIYGYNYQMLVSGLTPLPESRKLARDFPLMKRWGVMGFNDENRNVWAEAGIFSRYLRAQLEWNANADVEALADDFYAKWYGAAARPMRAFYDALEDAIENTPIHGHEDRCLPPLYTPELLATLRQNLGRAERDADTDSARLHVRADRLIYDHLAAYVRMSDAEADGNWAEAAAQAQKMLDIRVALHEISPFYIWKDEEGYHTGVWYWRVTDRRDFYKELADNCSGVTGDLVAMLPRQAMFRTDSHDTGLYEGWYKPDWSEEGWHLISTDKPFWLQGYQDEQGHTYVGNLWYRFKVDVPASAADKRKVVLFAPTVETEGWAWVNGKYVGYRPYMEAYVRPIEMECDVTDAIKPGETNVVVFRVHTSLAQAQAASGLMNRVFMYAPK